MNYDFEIWRIDRIIYHLSKQNVNLPFALLAFLEIVYKIPVYDVVMTTKGSKYTVITLNRL